MDSGIGFVADLASDLDNLEAAEPHQRVRATAALFGLFCLCFQAALNLFDLLLNFSVVGAVPRILLVVAQGLFVVLCLRLQSQYLQEYFAPSPENEGIDWVQQHAPFEFSQSLIKTTILLEVGQTQQRPQLNLHIFE